jgi:two-component system LytT family response regulator
MQITASILDDEFHAIEILAGYIRQVPELSLISTYQDPVLAMAAFHHTPLPDIIFLDLDMPGMSGLEVARLLTGRTTIILTTSYRDFGPEAYELAVTDYLLKPFSFTRFKTSLERALQQQPKAAPGNLVATDDLFVKSGNRLIKLSYKEILFIKSDRNYLDIHIDGKVITTYSTLNELESSLPPQFRRVHRSYIVNLDHSSSVEQGHLLMRNGSFVAISDKYRSGLIRFLQSKLIGQGEQKGLST